MLPGESNLINIQLVLFTRNISQYLGADVTTFINELNTSLNNIFNTTPTILPLPSNAPQEIPKVILNSNPEVYSCRIGATRIDFYMSINSPFIEGNIRADFHDKIQRIVNFLSEKRVEIVRIGYIANLESNLSPLPETSSQYIKNHFIADGILNAPLELGIRYVKREVMLPQVDTNILILLNQKGSGLSLDEHRMSIQFDINSAPERAGTLDSIQIQDFSSHALLKISTLIQNFPAI
jgi:hypothetical protein